jgi:hypothetical protein
MRTTIGASISRSASASGYAVRLVQYQDMGYILLSGHRLHSAHQVHPLHTQPHLRHNTLDFVRLQILATNLVETEIQIVNPIRHFL